MINDDVIRVQYIFDMDVFKELGDYPSYILMNDLECDVRVEAKKKEKDIIFFQTKTMKIKIVPSNSKKTPPYIEIRNNDDAIIYADLPERSYVSDHMKCRLHYLKNLPGTKYLGCGECTGRLLKNGRRIRCDPKDAIGYHPKYGGPLYKHVPFHIRAVPLKNRRFHAVGVWYNSTRPLVMDMGREISGYWPRYTYTKIEGGVDLDVFIFNGPKIKDVTSRFLEITGNPVVLPRHALGYLGSTMYFAELDKDCDKAHMDFVDKCRSRKIPIDGFQLSSGYTAQPSGCNDKKKKEEEELKRCTMTWNLTRFRDPLKWMKVDMFENRNVIVSPNTKPGMLVRHHKYYDRFAKIQGFFMDGKDHTKAYVGRWWGGSGSWIDFTNPKARDLFKTCLKENHILSGGYSVWCDNNEFELELDENPPTACWDNAKHRRSAAVAKTLQANLMARTAYEAASSESGDQRPYIISRSGCTGIWRYAQIWSGDNRTSWSALRDGVAMLLGGGLCGLVNYGHDCAGFAGGRPSKELFVRWVQHGVFQPRFSIHSCNDDNSVTLPWMFDTPEESKGFLQYVNCAPSKVFVTASSAIVAAIRLRYELMPVFYSLMIDASRFGKPIVRPLCYEFQDSDTSDKCWSEGETFLLGESLLVANVLRPESEIRGFREVYLPKTSTKKEEENGWYDFWTGQCYKGGTTLEVQLKGLSHIPLFLRSSCILPLASHDSPVRSTRDKPKAIRFLITTLQSCERFSMYEEKEGSKDDREIRLSTSISKLGDFVDLNVVSSAVPTKEYVFEFFVEPVPSEIGECDDRAPGKGAESVYLINDGKKEKLAMYLDRSKLFEGDGAAVNNTGWFFDMSSARVIVRLSRKLLIEKSLNTFWGSCFV